MFLPTSSPSPDFWGGKRPGNNEHANSVVALRAETGELVWSFQTVHHDVWDYDLPAQPTLARIDTGDGQRDVVIQPTKQGFVFVLDRDTGKPVRGGEDVHRRGEGLVGLEAAVGRAGELVEQRQTAGGDHLGGGDGEDREHAARPGLVGHVGVGEGEERLLRAGAPLDDQREVLVPRRRSAREHRLLHRADRVPDLGELFPRRPPTASGCLVPSVGMNASL